MNRLVFKLITGISSSLLCVLSSARASSAESKSSVWTPVDRPPYIEQFTSFYTSFDAESALQIICAAIGEMNFKATMADLPTFNLGQLPQIVRFAVFPSRSANRKLLGVLRTPEGETIDFVIKLYKGPGQEAPNAPTWQNLVEFQRRYGDVVKASSFYRELLIEIENQREFRAKKGSLRAYVPLACKQVPPARPSSERDGESTVHLDEATLNTLLDMASSSDVDVKREAIRAFLNSMRETHNFELITQNKKALEILTKIIADSLRARMTNESIRLLEQSTRLAAALAVSPAGAAALSQESPIKDLIAGLASKNRKNQWAWVAREPWLTNRKTAYLYMSFVVENASQCHALLQNHRKMQP